MYFRIRNATVRTMQSLNRAYCGMRIFGCATIILLMKILEFNGMRARMFGDTHTQYDKLEIVFLRPTHSNHFYISQ